MVTVAYWAICAALPDLRAGGDAASAILMPVEAIEVGNARLAFDHERIVQRSCLPSAPAADGVRRSGRFVSRPSPWPRLLLHWTERSPASALASGPSDADTTPAEGEVSSQPKKDDQE